MTDPIIVVGGGHAAAAFADKFRKQDTETPVVILSEESEYPYHRPPLSKKYLLGECVEKDLQIRSPEWYEEKQVEVRLNTFVNGISPASHQVTLASGEILTFSKLIIATGSRPRELPEDLGGQLSGVLTLRSLSDVDAMKPYFVEGKHILIVGGGYIGLEAAAVASKLGMKVTLVEAAERILQRVAAKETSDYFRQLHEDNGVTIIENSGLDSLEGNEQGHVATAQLSSGESLDIDVALIGIGAIANSEIAEAASLAVDNGIKVNEFNQTSDPDIYAAGDCANLHFRNQTVRFESVQNANAQADNIAKNICAENQLAQSVQVAEDNDALERIPYKPEPWFWSDQYDVKLQIAGFNLGYTDVITRDGAKPGAYSVWYFIDEQLVAVDAMNDPIAYVTGKKRISTDTSVDKIKLSDNSLTLKEIIG